MKRKGLGASPLFRIRLPILAHSFLLSKFQGPRRYMSQGLDQHFHLFIHRQNEIFFHMWKFGLLAWWPRAVWQTR